VVLLDEVEKAHHDVFNVLLQVLDDGRLTDGQGRTVDFKNVILVLTSNIGSAIIQEYFLDGADKTKRADMEARVMNELKAHFRPEFLNRLDDVIIFQSLDEEQLAAIVDIQLQKLQKRIAAQQIHLTLDKSARAWLAREGWDPQYGARPLKRAIQEHLLDPLATKLISAEFQPGDSIHVSTKNDQLVMRKS
jgi:ATP-dependent Clp protease ATP-binding subunit ClpB